MGKEGKTINQTKCGLKLSVAILFLIVPVCANLQGAFAQNNPNTITFYNQSGDPALVKLIGPTRLEVKVPNGQSRTVNVPAGEYYILARYGSEPKKYKYAKGDPFSVTQAKTQYSAITVTLHKVVGGNYPTHPISGEEFEDVPISRRRAFPISDSEWNVELISAKKVKEITTYIKTHTADEGFVFLEIEIKVKFYSTSTPWFVAPSDLCFVEDDEGNHYLKGPGIASVATTKKEETRMKFSVIVPSYAKGFKLKVRGLTPIDLGL